MTAHYDARETQAADAREAELMQRLPTLVAYAKERAPYFTKILADVDPAAITSRDALSALPVTRKSDLPGLQSGGDGPFGGLNAVSPGAMAHIFQSPGPIYEPEGRKEDWWRLARAFFAAGFRPGEIVHNTLSYHLSPGGFILDNGARAAGLAVVPAGVGQTEQQLDAIAHIKPHGYTGTTGFLKILVEKADEAGADISSLKKALVTGDALFPDVRAMLDGRGIQVTQCYATADLGLIAYETEAREGLVVSEDVIVEILRPGTGDPVAEGEVGEVVVTLFNDDYPLLRFATGDLSAVMPGESPCGRTNLRLRGWLGRADQSTKVKGMFVHPWQVAKVLKAHEGLTKARLEVTNEGGQDSMELKCEGSGDASDVAATLSAVTKLKGAVTFVGDGELPNDGMVIKDLRG